MVILSDCAPLAAFTDVPQGEAIPYGQDRIVYYTLLGREIVQSLPLLRRPRCDSRVTPPVTLALCPALFPW
jgi:hypothetical protein